MCKDTTTQHADIDQVIERLIASLMKEQPTEEELQAFEALRYERKARQGEALFHPGRLFCTSGAMDSLTPEEMMRAFARHLNGDWGEVCREDWLENERSLKQGFRLFSVYNAANGTRFWVITEADRSVTTVLLPSEY
jgi:hypothetical protein